MAGDSGIHFGRFVRVGREKKGLSLRALGNAIGRTESRMWQVEQMAEPRMHLAAVGKIAAALGYPNLDEFDRAWRSTPVPMPPPPASASYTIKVTPEAGEEFGRFVRLMQQGAEPGQTHDESSVLMLLMHAAKERVIAKVESETARIVADALSVGERIERGGGKRKKRPNANDYAGMRDYTLNKPDDTPPPPPPKKK